CHVAHATGSQRDRTFYTTTEIVYEVTFILLTVILFILNAMNYSIPVACGHLMEISMLIYC
ncbi:hypothetical protein, partial [Edwardsiella anguillarum]|uniref:hypothetical protein n=1 Tax=Edwardsiella anguillarum TaxID=1821960 RepID=UPI001ED9BC2C